MVLSKYWLTQNEVILNYFSRLLSLTLKGSGMCVKPVGVVNVDVLVILLGRLTKKIFSLQPFYGTLRLEDYQL